jgi:hypothetical protein
LGVAFFTLAQAPPSPRLNARKCRQPGSGSPGILALFVYGLRSGLLTFGGAQ